jgi:hypothetical protein
VDPFIKVTALDPVPDLTFLLCALLEERRWAQMRWPELILKVAPGHLSSGSLISLSCRLL